MYYEALNYFLETCTKENSIVETDANMMLFMQTWETLPVQPAEGLWNQMLEWDRVYGYFVRKGIVIEGLSESIRHRMRFNWDRQGPLHYMIWRPKIFT